MRADLDPHKQPRPRPGLTLGPDPFDAAAPRRKAFEVAPEDYEDPILAAPLLAALGGRGSPFTLGAPTDRPAVPAVPGGGATVANDTPVPLPGFGGRPPARPDDAAFGRRMKANDYATVGTGLAGLLGLLAGGTGDPLGNALLRGAEGGAAGVAGMRGDERAAFEAQREAHFGWLKERDEWDRDRGLETARRDERYWRQDEADRRDEGRATREAGITLAEGAGDADRIVRAYLDRYPGIDEATATEYAARQQVAAELERRGQTLDVEAREALVRKRQQEILTERARTASTEAQARQRDAQGRAAVVRAEAAAGRDDARAALYGRTDPNARRSGGPSAAEPPPPAGYDGGAVSDQDTADALRFYRAGQLTADEYEEITGRRPPR